MAIFRQLNKTAEDTFYLHQIGTTKEVYVDHQWVQIAQIDALLPAVFHSPVVVVGIIKMLVKASEKF